MLLDFVKIIFLMLQNATFVQRSKMFNLRFLSLLVTISIILSCSGDNMEDLETNKNYFPLTINNSWDYTSVTLIDENSLNNEQSLTLTNKEMSNDTLFFDTTSGNNLNLTTTGILSSGRLFKKEGRLQLKVQFSELTSGLPAEITLPITASAIPIYDKNADLGVGLFSESGSFSQDLNDLNINVEFTLSSQNTGSATIMEVNGIDYNDVLSSSITLNMKITATPDIFPIPIILLKRQNVLTAKHYFANDTGMIKSKVITSFNFEDFSQLGINLPDVDINTVQELESTNLVLP